MRLKQIYTPFELKASNSETGIVEGYGSIFDNVDAYSEIVVKGAFNESLKAHKSKKTMPAMLWQHNPDWPIGKWIDISEDDRGLKVSGKLNMKTSRGIDAFEHISAGDITGMSIGYRTEKYEVDEEEKIVTLKEIDLWEISLVTFPANELARIEETRSANEIAQMTEREIEHVLRDAGLSRSKSGAVISRISAIQHLRDAEAIEIAEAKAALFEFKLLLKQQSNSQER